MGESNGGRLVAAHDDEAPGGLRAACGADAARGPDPARATSTPEHADAGGRQRAEIGVVKTVPSVIGIVDDQELNRRLLRLMLGRSLGAGNVQFVEGASGPDAVDMRFGEEPPDLIILNGLMPRGDGPVAIAEIRRREAASGLPRLPLVIESGASAYLRDGLEAGADASFSLPVNHAEMCAIVRRLISRGAPST